MWFMKRSDRDFADEIESHIELETDRLMATGMNASDARAAATRAFGNRTRTRERFHEARGRVLVEQVGQDLRYAMRAMRRTPAFAIVATLCLGVGISVNTAAFSVLNAVMFRDYPGVKRQRDIVNVSVGFDATWGRSSPGYVSIADWELLRDGVPALSTLAAFSNLPMSVRVDGEPHAARGALVSDNYFDVLGTRPAAGRFMAHGDAERELDHVVVISNRFWKREMQSRSDVIGRAVTIGTRSFTIIGVAPEGFFGLYPGEVIDPDVGAPELFVPLAAAPYLRAESVTPTLDDRWLQPFGRLRAGTTLKEAQTQVNGVASRLAAAYPVERKNAFVELQAGGNRAKDAAEMLSAMLIVMVVPVIILLVACANLANQLLARAIQRSREIAVRLSLGATRARVVRQLLVESALLAVMASALGVLLARWLLDVLRSWVLVIPFRIAIDVRVLAFTIGLALVTSLVFGLAPALRATRTDLTNALKDGAPGSGVGRSRLRHVLVIAQIAASLALIAVSTVFVRTAERPPSAAMDALTNRSLLVAMDLDLVGFDAARGRAYQQQVLERLAALPGVAAVGMAPYSMFDMFGEQSMSTPDANQGKPQYFDVAEVSGAWFDANGITPMHGRLFTAAESRAPPTVAVVDEEFAHQMWGASDATGKTLRLGADSAPTMLTVIGVIPTRQEVTYRQPEGIVVIPGSRQYTARTFFYLRTDRASAPMIAAVHQVVHSLDPRVPVLWVRTLEDVASREAAPLTMIATGLSSLGAVALALAAVGLFGVLSFIVAQRRYEIGIRMALGAQRMDITWMVLKQAFRLGMAGVVTGAFLAFAVVSLLRALIHGVQSLDLSALSAMSLIMVFVALLASAVPARRAASVHPMESLRAE